MLEEISEYISQKRKDTTLMLLLLIAKWSNQDLEGYIYDPI